MFVFPLSILEKDISMAQSEDFFTGILLEKILQMSGNLLSKNGMKNFGIFQMSKRIIRKKTIHPCQYPIALIERCVLARTNEDDGVLDPYLVLVLHLSLL